MRENGAEKITRPGSRFRPGRRGWLAALFAAALCCVPAAAQDLGLPSVPGIVGGGFVGSEACKECHKNQYAAFQEHSRKSRSFEAIERMADGLTDEEVRGCYSCHTTGYGRPTGFANLEKTPELKDVGCESCHGPGRLHTQTMEMAHIVKTVTIDVCERCHDSEKITSFRYKSVIYAGAH
ncbi:MAG: cytochrome c family protein [Proteobacteria bacterium]|nr:cytochrome c family protein [Pseudomonadota bacterium]